MRALRFAVLVSLLLGGAAADVAPATDRTAARTTRAATPGAIATIGAPAPDRTGTSGGSMALLLLCGIAGPVAARWLGALAGQGRFLAT